MHGYISDLHWVMLQCTYLLCTIFIPYMESHSWVNAKNLTSCEFLMQYVNCAKLPIVLIDNILTENETKPKILCILNSSIFVTWLDTQTFTLI